MNTHTATQFLEDQPETFESDHIQLGRVLPFQADTEPARPFCLRSYTDNPYGVTRSRRLYGEYCK